MFSLQIYRQKSQVGVASTHSLSGMYVLTSIAQLETTGDSCVDRLARNPDHGKDPKTKEPQTCLVGRRLGDDWRCGGGGLAARPDSDMGEGSEQREEVEGMEVEEVEVEREEGDAVMVRLPKNYQLTGPTVWREPKLMSPWAARPLFLANIKEGRETMIPFFRNYLDPEIHLVTHYSSNPAWEGGEFCLWSARGRAAVRLEECTVTNVVTSFPSLQSRVPWKPCNHCRGRLWARASTRRSCPTWSRMTTTRAST